MRLFRRAVLIFATALLVACRSAPDPQLFHDRISQEILQGNLNAALADVDSASACCSSGSARWSWAFRIQKAQILISRAGYEQALSLLDGSAPAELAATEIPVLQVLFKGSADMYLGKFAESKSNLENAEALARSSQPRLLCQVFNAKGALAAAEGDYLSAEQDYQQALQFARDHQRSDVEAPARVGLAWVATHRHHFDEAADLGRSALQLTRSLGMHRYTATTLGNLGWTYSELGDYETARDFYMQGAQESTSSGMSGQSAYWFSSVANAYLALHDYKQAEDLALTTLQRARELHNAEVTAVCLNTLSDILLRTDRIADAARYNQEALELIKNGENKFGAIDSWTTAARVATAKREFSSADELYLRVLSDPSLDPAHRWASYAGLARIKDGEGNYAEAEKLFGKAIDTIEQARRSVGHDELRLSFLTSGIEIYGQYIDFLVRRGRQADALRQADLSRARTLEEGLRASGQTAKAPALTISPQQLAQRLKSTLLFYWLGAQQSYVWVITPKQTACFPLPPAGELDPLLKSYAATLLGTRDPLESGSGDGQKLYSTLVAPLCELLRGTSRVIVLPDGSLYGLNFETLIVPDPKPHYWIEDVTLSTANSLALLASSAMPRPPTKEQTLLLVGDTISPNDSFPRLVQASDEMKNIEKYFPIGRTSVLSGATATPAAYLRSSPAHYRYLHFVTHGTASRTRPLESAVVLSKDKDEESYKLYARDIVTRPLNANLVTISACNTSGTRTFSGEGLVGLSWAFLRAGAHNVIGALWEVSDASTPRLMDKLYDGLSHTTDPASALRAAKLSLLHSDSVFRKPFYWAPFQLYTGS